MASGSYGLASTSITKFAVAISMPSSEKDSSHSTGPGTTVICSAVTNETLFSSMVGV